MKGPVNYSVLDSPRKGALRRLLKELARLGGEASFTDLLRALGGEDKVARSTLSHRLKALEYLEIIKYSRGRARLRYKTPLCYIVGAQGVEYAYMGLLGTKDTREKSETETAIELLRQDGYEFSKIVIATTPEALDTWQSSIPDKLWRRIENIPLSIKEMNDIEAVRQKVAPRLEELISNYTVVMDCTSGTRPAGIAYYSLATEYLVPIIYVYEATNTFYWLQSKEMLQRKLISIVEA